MMYELSKNPVEIERLTGLPQKQMLIEFGKLEARLSTEGTKPVVKKQTNAPPPISPVGSKTAGDKKTIYDSDIDQQEYERLRREQMRKRA
jgi:hypothetical protein